MKSDYFSYEYKNCDKFEDLFNQRGLVLGVNNENDKKYFISINDALIITVKTWEFYYSTFFTVNEETRILTAQLINSTYSQISRECNVHYTAFLDFDLKKNKLIKVQVERDNSKLW